MWSLNTAKRAIVFAGCLAAVYTQLTTSPATIQYIRSIGANEFHIGILAALPTLMLFMQFVAAIVVNHLSHRRRVWFWAAMTHRLMLLPTALGPWLFPDVSDSVWVWMLLITTTLNQGLLHFSAPLWLSWMGDYLPHQGLSTFWGHRQLCNQFAAAISLCGAAFMIHCSGLSIEVTYIIMTCVGTLCGVIDLMMFRKIDEPPVRRVPSPQWFQVMAEPFRHREFRRYISFMCFYNFATMAGAPFIALYLLADVGMDLYHVMLLSTLSWVGGAVASRMLGRWADAHGSQPVLVMCVSLKSINMLALLLIPNSVDVAFWILAPVFMIDAALNAGILIANNGFMIKNSPVENRAMYIAATQAVAGMAGGVTSILAGWMLKAIAGREFSLWGWTLGHFQVMFLVSILLRWTALALTRFVHEPRARHTWHVVQDLAAGFTSRFWRPQVAPAIPAIEETMGAPVMVEPAAAPAIPAPKQKRPRRLAGSASK